MSMLLNSAVDVANWTIVGADVLYVSGSPEGHVSLGFFQCHWVHTKQPSCLRIAHNVSRG